MKKISQMTVVCEIFCTFEGKENDADGERPQEHLQKRAAAEQQLTLDFKE